MKRSVLVFVICCCYQYVVCQDTQQRDSVMYKVAYEYIANDSICKNKLVVVADSIVDLDRYWETGLEQFPEERKKLVQYWKEQWKRYFAESTTYYSPFLASLFPNQDIKRSNFILFFSEVADLMLRADINIYNKKWIPECEKFRYDAYIWGTAYHYLFIFNEDGTIRKVLWREMMLN